MNILVTGGAGFIGSSTVKELLKQKHSVVGIDNLNDYYNPEFKKDNIKDFKIKFYEEDIRDYDKLDQIFSSNKIDKIIHLAAMVGVRPSIENPFVYEEVNVKGTMNILELARKHKIKKVVFASSSSVYGDRDKIPFSEDDATNSQISPYAVTKKAGELLCYNYSNLYKISCTCLRFFTVYGPSGRPDMAPYKFVERIANGKEIEMFGDGTTKRDYTFVSDVVQGVVRSLNLENQYEIINLGCGNPIKLKDFIELIEKNLGKRAKISRKEMQKGDVSLTYADISKAKRLLDYDPKVKIEEGIKILCEWYLKNRLNRK